MTKQEYLERLAALTASYEKLNAERHELEEAYRRDNQPCQYGDIVEISFPDTNAKSIIGMVCDKDFLYRNGEFRPSLSKVVGDKLPNKRIHYDGHTPINIKVLGRAPTCSQCLWRVLHEDKMYCKLGRVESEGKLQHLGVVPDKIMCSEGNFVRWEGDTPWKQNILTTIKNNQNNEQEN